MRVTLCSNGGGGVPGEPRPQRSQCHVLSERLLEKEHVLPRSERARVKIVGGGELGGGWRGARRRECPVNNVLSEVNTTRNILLHDQLLMHTEDDTEQSSHMEVTRIKRSVFDNVRESLLEKEHFLRRSERARVKIVLAQ